MSNQKQEKVVFPFRIWALWKGEPVLLTSYDGDGKFSIVKVLRDHECDDDDSEINGIELKDLDSVQSMTGWLRSIADWDKEPPI
jgi:hypothetical protein